MFENQRRRLVSQTSNAAPSRVLVIPCVDDDRLEGEWPQVRRSDFCGHAFLYHPGFAEFRIEVGNDPVNVAAKRLADGLAIGLAHDLAPWQRKLLSQAVAEVQDYAKKIAPSGV
jgi:hypothetical protein